MSCKIKSTWTKKLHEKPDLILDDIESILCHLISIVCYYGIFDIRCLILNPRATIYFLYGSAVRRLAGATEKSDLILDDIDLILCHLI